MSAAQRSHCGNHLSTSPLTSFFFSLFPSVHSFSPSPLVRAERRRKPFFLNLFAPTHHSQPPMESSTPQQASAAPSLAAGINTPAPPSTSSAASSAPGSGIAPDQVPMEDVVSTNAVTAEAIARQNQTVVGALVIAVSFVGTVNTK